MLLNSKMRQILLILVFAHLCLIAQDNPDPERFIEEIRNFRQWDRKNALPDDHVLFLGSSSIRMWMTAEWFPEKPVVNRGFGGAHISDLLYFREDILLKYDEPACIVFYCGGNDIAGGKTAERVVLDFQAFWSVVQNHFFGTPLVYIPIKPCPDRWLLWEEENEANMKIKNLCEDDPILFYADTAAPMLQTGKPPADSLFIVDGLHLNENGYKMWSRIVDPFIEKSLNVE